MTHYFGIFPSKLAELVPLPYSRGRSSCYSNRMHDFSVIPRCYKDAYVNVIFLHSQSLEFFAINALSFDILSKWLCLQLIDTFLVFLSTTFSNVFHSLSHRFLVTSPRSGCSAFYGLNPSKKVKNHGNKRKAWFLLPLEHISKWWEKYFKCTRKIRNE